MITSRQRFGLVLLIAAALLGGCAWSGSGMRPVMMVDGQRMNFDDPVERGRGLVATGQYGLAIEGLSAVVTQDPHDARALSLLAISYAQLKRFDLADRYHAQALEIDPDSVVVLNNWGYSYLVRGDGDRAAALLARAAEANDGRQIVTANLALVRGNDAATAPADEVVVPMRSIRISSHVTLVRPAARLKRVAPGVQMLVTTTPPEAPEQRAPEAPAMVSQVSSAAGDAKSAVTTDWRLFQALFALMEGDVPPSADALVVSPHQLAEASSAAPRSPFGFFPDVDDFTKP